MRGVPYIEGSKIMLQALKKKRVEYHKLGLIGNNYILQAYHACLNLDCV